MMRCMPFRNALISPSEEAAAALQAAGKRGARPATPKAFQRGTRRAFATELAERRDGSPTRLLLEVPPLDDRFAILQQFEGLRRVAASQRRVYAAQQT
jgi:hypothetical protein